MKSVARVLATASALALVCAAFGQQSPVGKQSGRAVAAAYKSWGPIAITNSVASGSATINLASGIVTFPDGESFSPFTTYTPITVGNGSDVEVVTPSAIGTCNASSCAVTATFANAHSVGEQVSAGDHGIGEAISVLGAAGGLVVVDPSSGASASSITSAGGGSSSIGVESLLSGSPTYYAWSGSAFVSAGGSALAASANGAQLKPFYNEELLTLSTSGVTTDTTGNLLPANSVILGVAGRVTTTITSGCTGWELGDATTAARFTASLTTLTAGTTNVGSVQLTTGVASATTGMFQASAAKVRVTCATAAPGAGAIRISVFGYTIVPAQQ